MAIAYVALLAAGSFGGSWLLGAIGLEPNEEAVIVNSGPVWIGLLIYTVLLAIPFVPGIEISIALLGAFGSVVALQVYIASVIALCTAFAVGRAIPATALAALFRSLNATSAENLVLRLKPLSAKERLAVLVENAPSRLVPTLIRYRYLALILMLNLPGNAILGGGGGIALLAGLSGLFSGPMYVLSICVAVLPLPLAAVFLGRLF
ncbi:MAG: hypothetical protein AAFV45_00125 [Pseudomonadota bacterium]